MAMWSTKLHYLCCKPINRIRNKHKTQYIRCRQRCGRGSRRCWWRRWRSDRRLCRTALRSIGACSIDDKVFNRRKLLLHVVSEVIKRVDQHFVVVDRHLFLLLWEYENTLINTHIDSSYENIHCTSGIDWAGVKLPCAIICRIGHSFLAVRSSLNLCLWQYITICIAIALAFTSQQTINNIQILNFFLQQPTICFDQTRRIRMSMTNKMSCNFMLWY